MTLVEKATKEIRDMIVNHQYDDERYLPTEGELCEILGVSRATIREAVRSLEVRGLVQRIHGKGVKVVDNAVGTLTQTLSDLLSIGDGTVMNLIEVRNIIETAVAKLAAERATKPELQELEAAVRNMEEATEMDEAYMQADLRFHLAMVEASHNPVLKAIVQSYIPLLEDTIRAASSGEEVIEKKYHYHRDILTAISSGKAIEAEHAIERHLIATENNAKSRVKG